MNALKRLVDSNGKLYKVVSHGGVDYEALTCKCYASYSREAALFLEEFKDAFLIKFVKKCVEKAVFPNEMEEVVDVVPGGNLLRPFAKISATMSFDNSHTQTKIHECLEESFYEVRKTCVIPSCSSFFYDVQYRMHSPEISSLLEIVHRWIDIYLREVRNNIFKQVMKVKPGVFNLLRNIHEEFFPMVAITPKSRARLEKIKNKLEVDVFDLSGKEINRASEAIIFIEALMADIDLFSVYSNPPVFEFSDTGVWASNFTDFSNNFHLPSVWDGWQNGNLLAWLKILEDQQYYNRLKAIPLPTEKNYKNYQLLVEILYGENPPESVQKELATFKPLTLDDIKNGVKNFTKNHPIATAVIGAAALAFIGAIASSNEKNEE